ncbi:MAG: FtsQ-type POTRA domain-containing protein [Victivallales bacterium]|nr:FtsQ-type POTRA domain-containing protein [Victivallales bacterium]
MDNVQAASLPAPRKRGRIIRAAILLIGGVLLLLAFLYCLRWTRNFLFRQNPHFQFRQLVMEPTEHFSHAQVRTLMEEAGCVMPRTNLLTLDLRALRARFLANPLVSTVEINRILPETLHVVLTERRPIAIVVNPQNQIAGYLDNKGIPFPCLDRKNLPTTLPYIFGALKADAPELKMGTTTDIYGLISAVQFIQILTARPQIDGASFYVNAISISYPHEQLICRLTPFVNNTVIKKDAILYIPMDPEKMDPALDRLEAILKDKIQNNGTLSFANLTLEINVNTKD